MGDYQGVVTPFDHLQGGPPLNTGDMGPFDVQGHVDFWWRTGLTSSKLYHSVQKACPALGQEKPDRRCMNLGLPQYHFCMCFSLGLLITDVPGRGYCRGHYN